MRITDSSSSIPPLTTSRPLRDTTVTFISFEASSYVEQQSGTQETNEERENKSLTQTARQRERERNRMEDS